jgi:hypothetical protein
LRGVLDTTLCDKVCQLLATGRQVVFTGYSGFLKQKQKNDRHDITEILFKVALNTINQTEQNYTYFVLSYLRQKKII